MLCEKADILGFKKTQSMKFWQSLFKKLRDAASIQCGGERILIIYHWNTKNILGEDTKTEQIKTVFPSSHTRNKILISTYNLRSSEMILNEHVK